MNSSVIVNDVDKTSVDSLIKTLNSKDGLARQHARHALVQIGEPALPALFKAFEKKEDIMHWEIAKALSQIGSPKAAEFLVNALEDKEFSIRWLAAEGLIHIGNNGVAPLLTALKERPDVVWLREGAHHIFHDLVSRKLVEDKTRELLTPLLDALNHIHPEVEVSSAAAKVLDLMKAE
jgi:HEAT repeat protein